MPYSVLRIYAQAPGLVDALLANEDAVRDLLTSIGGFRFWGLARTDEGGASLTVCETAGHLLERRRFRGIGRADGFRR
ncbi:MAG TPA: hypothetical protein VGJ60_25575 [Chloroflexota bacterium]|jgi:hypothetical protein